MDAKEIAEIYSIRSLLETEALRLSCAGLTTADLDRAATLLVQIDAEMDVGRWGTLNKQFHMTLYGACQNERLIGLIATHHDAADRYVRVLLSSLDYEQQSQNEHRALLKASLRRSEDRCCNCNPAGSSARRKSQAEHGRPVELRPLVDLVVAMPWAATNGGPASAF